MKFSAIATFLLGAASSLALTGAAPLEKRDVYAPPVLYPHAGTVWYSGQKHNVTWYVYPHECVTEQSLTKVQG